MNEMYSNHILKVLIPHVLSCFEHIFPSSTRTAAADANKDKKSSKKKFKPTVLEITEPLSSETQTLLKDNLSPDLCDLYNTALESFKKANLVKEPVDVSELSKLKNAANTTTV